jgi:hypothetical protein
MAKRLGKKGIFLSLISILIIAAFLIIFSSSGIELKKDLTSTKTRIENVNDYVLDMENVYLERILEAVGRRALISLVLYINLTDQYVANLKVDFAEVLTEGTIGGVPIDDITGQSLMTGNTYVDWINKFKATAKSLYKVDTLFSVNRIHVFQEDPWTVNVWANTTFAVYSETAKWEKRIMVKTKIDIEKLHDPYYLINTNGLYSNRINRTEFKVNEWDEVKLKHHIKYGEYVHFEDSDAPSFLMRFNNTIRASSCCGIESIVNPDKLLSPDQEESYADYQFFSQAVQCEDLYNINSVKPEYDFVKLDLSHISLYRIPFTDVTSTTCPS